MTPYQFPLTDAQFVLHDLLAIDQHPATVADELFSADCTSTVLSESAKVCEQLIAPLNVIGDSQGAYLKDQHVKVPEGFKQAYQQYATNGWTSLTATPAYQGQGLPHVLGTACSEMLQSANLAFSLLPLLTAGAIDAIETHGSESLKQQYLANMISGRWSGTMNLTEPNAGSDLAAVKTQAIPEHDYYRIKGQKVYITWGEHDLADNIVHLVLARLPDAPAGVKGISLFLVPKWLTDANGAKTQRNDVQCLSLEHKLGIHASPTCVMAFGENEGAIGYLLGQAHQGLACMFTMMNAARQGVGLQGLAVAERAYQQALVFAVGREQGTKADGSRFTINCFADVRRLLMLQKSATEAMRALAYYAAFEIDQAKLAVTQNHAHIELLTPIIKAWMTELAQVLIGFAVQIHGGMGYIEETGVAQYLRDARILTIYEGTTAIQGNDLIGRKILYDKGASLTDWLATMRQLLSVQDERLSTQLQQFSDALTVTETTLQWCLKHATDKHVANAVGSNMALLLGYLGGGWLMVRAAILCLDRDDAFAQDKLNTTKFYCAHWLPEIKRLATQIQAGAEFLDTSAF